jgi:hypothetical protein
MTSLQHSLFGAKFRAVGKKSNADLLRTLLPETLEDSKTAAMIAWMDKPAVIAFIASIPTIQEEQLAHEAYIDHMVECGSFEAIARDTRKVKSDCKNGKVIKQKAKTKKKSPSWYLLYLGTDHWTSIRDAVLAHYQLCVLCGYDGKVAHHRHYNTLGKESATKDMSLLCENCHYHIHDWTAMRVPKKATVGAIEVLEREGLCNGKHKP